MNSKIFINKLQIMLLDVFSYSDMLFYLIDSKVYFDIYISIT